MLVLEEGGWRCVAQHAHHYTSSEDAKRKYQLLYRTPNNHADSEWWNRLWLVLPLENPSDTALPPFLSFSNNVGLTWALLRSQRSLQQIKDNLHLIHVIVFIPLCYSLDYYYSPLQTTTGGSTRNGAQKASLKLELKTAVIAISTASSSCN